MLFYYGVLFLIIGTAIFMFIKAGSRKIRDKNLSFVMVGLGINILASPLALFIGTMATASPNSTRLDFWKGFLFIQKIPLIILLLALIWWFIRKNKKKVHM
ncbi:putative membrane protein [Bacillus clarus]|nr:putative membrane protein [Bacillus clarus]